MARDTTGDLVQEEPTVQLSSFLEKNNVSYVIQATTVLSLMLQQPQDFVMRDFSAIMALTNNNHLVVTEVMQEFVPQEATVHRVIH